MKKSNRQQKPRRAPQRDLRIDLVNKNRDAVQEYFNSVRINIDYSIVKEEGGGKIFLVTSGLECEGKSFCAVNLARSFADIAENRVLIIDCDLHASMLHRSLNMRNDRGLTDYLSKKVSFADVCVFNRLENFYVITSGTKAPNPGVFLSSKLFQTFLSQLKMEFDYVIIDAPPVLQITDTCSFASYTDGAVIVVRADRSTIPELKSTIGALEKAQSNILGVVLNDVDFTKRGFRNSYGYGYGYGYGDKRR